MGDFLAFRRMITPVIIQGLFWIGVAFCVLTGLAMLAGLGDTGRQGGGGRAAGLLVIVIGPVVVRIWCELLILFFRINETLTEIQHEIRGQSAVNGGATVATPSLAPSAPPSAPPAFGPLS